MLLGAGIPQEVDVWQRRLTGPKRIERRLMNPRGERAWLDGYDCLWRTNGVWDLDPVGRPRLLRPDHFTQVDGRPVNFNRDYYIPFNNRFARAMREVHPGAMIFVEKEFELDARPGIRAAPRTLSTPRTGTTASSCSRKGSARSSAPITSQTSC